MKKILITGAAGGVGKAIVRHFLRQGWYVFASDIDCASLDEFLDHENFKSIQIDVTNDKSIANAVIMIRALTSSLDALVNNAGRFDHFPLVEGQPGQFENLLSINVLGAARMTRAVFPMLQPAQGRIVNISSETAMASLPMQVYGLSKRMLEVYTDALRQEVELVGIKVILIRPGAHATTLFSQSRQALGHIKGDSAFMSALSIVRDKGRKIIDRGSADPKDIAEATYRALTVQNPRRIYPVNVSGRFRILACLPRRLKEYIVHRMLTSKD